MNVAKTDLGHNLRPVSHDLLISTQFMVSLGYFWAFFDKLQIQIANELVYYVRLFKTPEYKVR
jgi:hypothetical protein